MPGQAKLSGIAIAYGVAGFVLFWSGLKNQTLTVTVTDLLKGQNPAASPEAPPTLGVGDANSTTQAPESGTAAGQENVTTPGSGTDAANEALGKLMAGGYGWATGANWTALNYGWGTLESGWNANALNASSGAYGIAQALGHGTAATKGTVSDAYGTQNGISTATAKAANSGSAAAQIAWGLAYIKATYGSPSQVPGWTGGSYSGY
jgi:hypothetical protein